jgi:hypothetical protein
MLAAPWLSQHSILRLATNLLIHADTHRLIDLILANALISTVLSSADLTQRRRLRRAPAAMISDDSRRFIYLIISRSTICAGNEISRRRHRLAHRSS